ncbi:conjugative transfer protein TraD (plasmid) [Desulfosarcina ovata subsp. sediminis]|uniref:Conjugative transfer protein TraD n=1 Tax=Desulfosarcina ovata subsp. sediminis TaxID=885957 RepID=A0A5K8A2L6_9BACT|nr:type IV secretion system DNA-binding domain-containing protein [Desulfosarcina ovata]BBO86772.1 conjugative transfer protein TraD [Desulfosarcina ovata subsp. sediminis]
MRTDSFEGFEVLSNKLKMSYKMHKTTLLVLLLLIVLSFFTVVKYTYTYDTYLFTRWVLSKTLSYISPSITLNFINEDGSHVRVKTGTLVETDWLNDAAAGESARLLWILGIMAAVSYLGIYPGILYLFGKRSTSQSNELHIRGAKFIVPREYNTAVRKGGVKTALPFASVRMPINNETRGTLLVGKPGKGKTVCLSGVLENIKERKGKAVVYDYKGDYVQKFYDPDIDLIFNPLDTRSIGWSLKNEIDTYMDIDAIASSLVPESISNADPFWPDSARGVFAGCLHCLYRSEKNSNADLWDLLTADAEVLTSHFKGVKGAEAGRRYIDMNDKTSRQADSVLSVTMQHSKCFEYMGGCEGDFKTADWLKDERPGIIFITNYEIIQHTLKPILSLFIDLLCRRFLSMNESYDRRIFFLLDEIGTLQRLPSLVKFITNIRSKGGAPFVGVQDFGQLDKIYSDDISHTIVSALNNNVYFALSDKSAKRASDNIGDYECYETERSYSLGVSDIRDGVTMNRRKKKEPLVLPSEIQSMRDLETIIKFENYDFIRDKFEYKLRPDMNQPFILRPDLSMDYIIDQERQLVSGENCPEMIYEKEEDG